MPMNILQVSDCLNTDTSVYDSLEKNASTIRLTGSCIHMMIRLFLPIYARGLLYRLKWVISVAEVRTMKQPINAIP